MSRTRGGYRLSLPSGVMLASALATLIVLGLADSARAQPTTSLAIVAGTGDDCVEIDEGDQIQVQIRVENVSDLQSWEATVVHDRDVLEIIEQDSRQFLAEEPNSNVLTNQEPLPDYNGRHLLGASDLSNASESGNGVLAVLVFEAVGEGSTAIGIPQFDINNDGKVDEGGWLSAFGGVIIGDVNGDRFFDGQVTAAIVAVETDCQDITTDEPTDPPTPTNQPPGGGGDPTPGDTGPGSSDPGDSGSPGDPGGGDDPTEGDNGSSPVDGSPGASGDDQASPSEGADEGGGATGGTDDGDGGGSFPAWLVAALLVGGLAAGAVVVTLAVRRSSGDAL